MAQNSKALVIQKQIPKVILFSINDFRLSKLFSALTSLRLPPIAGFHILTFLLFTFAFSLFTSVNAQVVIKENVEINPQNVMLPNNPTQNYTLRVEVDWDALEEEANNHFWDADLQVNVVLKNSCDQIVDETGFVPGWTTGSTSLSTIANSYGYEILVTVTGFYDSYQFVDLTVRTYLNNTLLETFTRQVNSGNWPYFSETRTTGFNQYVYLTDEFDFRINNDLMEYGCFSMVDLRINPNSNCSSSIVASLANDPINLTITEGSEYLAFYDNNLEEIIGSSVQTTQQYFNLIDLIYENPLRDTISKIAIIQLESNGIVETDSIEILPVPDDLSVTIYPGEITSGEEAYLDIFLDYCPPFETTINVEIIKGQEYGSLINPYTNERTKKLTNLEHWFGSVFLEYIADGKSSLGTDTVVIKASTNDPEIVPKEVSLIMKPPSIYVFTEPEVVSASDTADVIIKKRNADGTLEDFPPDKVFELAVLDGCVNGNILVGTTVDVYFADALQPIKFVTADSLESDNGGDVRLRVGTDLSGIMIPTGNIKGEKEKQLSEKREELIGNSGYSWAELRAGFKKMMEEKKAERIAEKIKTGGEPSPDAPIIEACYIGSYINEIGYWEGDVEVLSSDGCENLSSEHSEINYLLKEQPEFFIVPHSDEEELKLAELIQVCNDTTKPNQHGGSLPVDYKRYRYEYATNSFKNSWRLEPYKGIDDRVHYYFVNPQTNESTILLFDFVTGVCYLKINPPGKPPKTIIENLSDVYDKIPSDSYEQAFVDFCGYLCYPTENAVYVLLEIIETHEREHMKDFEEIIAENFPMLVQEIEDYSDLCESYSEEVRKNAEKVIYNKVEVFIQKMIKEFRKISGEPGSENELKHERIIQKRNSIVDRIEEYKNELKKRFVTHLLSSNCQKCSYE